MIIVELLGGLGNQLFQYCLGRRLASDYGVPLALDTFLLEDRTKGRHAVQRRFSLDVFSIDVPFVSIRESIRYSAWGLPRPLRAISRGLGITNESLRTREDRFGFDARILECGPDAYLSGLWQSVRYFQPVERSLREELKFRWPLPESSRRLADRLRRGDSVCLHVRRTDYLSAAASDSQLGFIGLDYYKRACHEVLANQPDARFFVFSDDLDWCRKTLNFLPRVEFVGNEHAGYKDSGHLHLMSLCRTFVIPNSTFSWWAAWLGTQNDKVVYLPEHWFRDSSVDSSGLYPAGWIRVPDDRLVRDTDGILMP